MTSKVKTCLWFDGVAEEAAAFYVSLLPGSRIEGIFRPEPEGAPLLIDFTLAGTPYLALNGGPQFPHTEAASIVVETADQAETDHLWVALTANGGTAVQCGWLRDRFGLSWQIVPEIVPRLLSDPDRAAAGRALQALMGMGKIDIAALKAAHRGS